MIAKLSKKLASFYVKKNYIDEEEIETYEYCFEVFISTIMNLIVLISVGLVTRRYIETAIFIVIFIFLRECCGGYHAKTHLGCFISIVCTFGLLIVLTYINKEVLFVISIPLFAVSTIFNLLAAPVGCKNKPIEEKQQKKLKNKVFLICVILAICFILLACFRQSRYLCFSIAYPSVAITVSILVELVTKD